MSPQPFDPDPPPRVNMPVLYRLSADDVDRIRETLPRAWHASLGDSFPGVISNVVFTDHCDLSVRIDGPKGAVWTLDVTRRPCGVRPGMWTAAAS